MRKFSAPGATVFTDYWWDKDTPPKDSEIRVVEVMGITPVEFFDAGEKIGIYNTDAYDGVFTVIRKEDFLRVAQELSENE